MNRTTPFFCVIALILSSSLCPSAQAGDRCKNVSGHMEETVVTPMPAMTTSGSMNGWLKGRYDFTLFSAFPAEDPAVLFFTGRSTIDTGDGVLSLTDAGVLDTASSTVADLLTISGGTGPFEGASGQIVLTGIFDLVTGLADFRYSGEVCLP